MNIKGLDYNSQRERLVLPEYGREVQKMVDYCMTLPTKAQRQRCANTIIKTMEIMTPHVRDNAGYRQKLWDQLAEMSNFKLDIDWPIDITQAQQIKQKPQPIKYPATQLRSRTYGKLLMDIFEKLKQMPPCKERDELTASAANQMKRDLVQWGHVGDDEKIADDLARYTDGVIQLDLKHFRFAKVDMRALNAAKNGNPKGKKRRKR